jgi:hypothetical protein
MLAWRLVDAVSATEARNIRRRYAVTATLAAATSLRTYAGWHSA